MDSRLRAYPIHGLVGWLDKRARREMMMMGGFSQVLSGFLLVFGSSLTLSLSPNRSAHTTRTHAWVMGLTTGFMAWFGMAGQAAAGCSARGRDDDEWGGFFLSRVFRFLPLLYSLA